MSQKIAGSAPQLTAEPASSRRGAALRRETCPGPLQPCERAVKLTRIAPLNAH
ncbi:hypothetical protein JYU34_019070 [Plutella xylostella]|uniref:Uncharacterized protein n=1 Tax=Plutella xylostella TaxID=51655 RepID=A0ABQ7Q0K3_PLUXY|nr:hypothetical protein JYU34_019070 [Plutella xylostella]